MELHWVARREGKLSSFLLGELRMSAGMMNKYKWGDGIRVNGIPQRTNYLVKPEDEITVSWEEAEPDYPAEDGDLSVLYEDDFLLAVDKPAGMLIHPSHSQNTGTLANLVYGYYQKTGYSGAFHPMTRLDRDTFGIVLLAKNAHVHNLLQQVPIQKTYHALTFGGPAEAEGVIDAPIARKPLPSLLREIRPDGKPSVTRFRVLERWEKICKLALEPVTGRTHQLRLHCAWRGYPILGDPQYGSFQSQTLSQQLGLKSQMLCAKKLELVHPMTGENMILESEMEPRFSER